MALRDTRPMMFLFVLLAVGCGADAPVAPPGDCVTRTDCAVDELCRDGRCVLVIGGVDLGAIDDAGTLDDSGAPSDSGPPEDAAVVVDASVPGDAAVMDAGGPSDAGPVADAGVPNACEAAGGSCVRGTIGCRIGVIGDPATYSCGPGPLRLECCLPRSTPPTCGAIGTRSEGWVAPDGTRICYARCAGATLSCENAGLRDEGWYADPVSAACSVTLPAGLVERANCAP